MGMPKPGLALTLASGHTAGNTMDGASENTKISLLGKRSSTGKHASCSRFVQAGQVSSQPASMHRVVKPEHCCHEKASALREKAEKSSSTQCFYTKISEPRKVSSANLIDNRNKLAMFVNSMFSCEQIKCGQGSNLDVVFVPHDRGAASIRFPPMSPEHTWDGSLEEKSPDGTAWSSASKNAAFVMLTQNEGTMSHMIHPKLVH